MIEKKIISRAYLSLILILIFSSAKAQNISFEKLRTLSNDSFLAIENKFKNRPLDSNIVLITIDKGRRIGNANIDSALAIFSNALALSKKIKYTNGEYIAMYNHAALEISRSNYEKSIPVILKCIDYFKKNNDIINQNRASITYAYTLTGYQPDTAIKIYNDVLINFEKLGIYNRAYIATLAALMELNEINGYHDKNIPILHKMKEKSEASKDSLFILVPLIQLAYSHFKINNIDSGNYYLSQAELFQNFLKNNVMQYHYHKTLGYKSQLQGKLQDANDHYIFAFHRSENLGNPKVLMPLLKSIVDNFEQLKMYEQASNFWKIYYETSKKFYNNNNEAKIGLILANKNIDDAKNSLQLEKEKNNLTQKNNKYTVIIFSLSLILMSIALYHYINRNKVLIAAKELAEKNLMLVGLGSDLSKKESELSGQLNERKRIARELHDGLGINLVTLKLFVENTIKNNPSVQKILVPIKNKVSELSNEIRMISHNITPPEFDKEKYSEIVKNLIQGYNIVLGSDAIKYSIHGDNHLNEIDLLKKVNIYRIIQESLNNIHKHANATEINLIIIATNETIDVIIEDNGIGFDIDSIKNLSGINNLKNRAKEMDADLHISSKKNRGTEIALKINMN